MDDHQKESDMMQPYNILVVEDDASMQKSLSRC